MTADQIDIQHEFDGQNGRYFARLADGAEAEMTYRNIGEGIIAIDHTLVPDAFRGMGVAQKLVFQAVGDAQQNGTKIQPICSYVVAQFKRHPEWADLKAT